MSSHGLAYVLSAVVCVVAGQALLKIGMTVVGPIDAARVRRFGELTRSLGIVWQLYVGLGLYVISAALWILALATVPLSIAYPFLGLSYVGVAGVSVIALGEWLTPAQWLGIALVIAGVVTVALS